MEVEQTARQQLTCYYCGCPATSNEHVPPRCMFPEQKDTLGIDYRKNLITVPSCDEHNLRKSKADEFLMACITPVVDNNSVGYLQTQTKLNRAINRTEGRLLNTAMHDQKELKIVANNGIGFPVLVGKANMPRLCNILESIARGLYFYEKRERFTGRCCILPRFINYDGNTDIELIKRITALLVNQEKQIWKKGGDNPDVFFYQLGPTDQYGLIPMLMTFFRGTEVYVSFQPEGIKLPHRTLNEATPENPIVIEITKAV